MFTPLVFVYLLLLAAIIAGIVWRKETLYVALVFVSILLLLAIAGVRV